MENEDSKNTISRRSFLALGSAAAVAVAGSSVLTACSPSGSGSSGSAAAPVATTPANSSGTMTPGVYEASAPGFIAPITATVTMSDSRIEDIQIASRETVAVGTYGLQKMAERVIEHQSVNVDTIAGATISSIALRTALLDTLDQAGAQGDFEKPVAIPYVGPDAVDVETDVVIIGGGCAGMITAVNLARAGVPVILCDKRQMFGGTSSRAGYQIFGVQSRAQIEKDNPAKTIDEFYDQYIVYGAGKTDPTWERMRSEAMPELLDWLRFDIGMPLDTPEVGGLAVILNAESEHGQGRKLGGVMIELLWKELERLGVDIRLETRGLEIILDGDKAVGMKVESPNGTYNIKAKANVIATGAFGSNPELVEKYLPNWVGFPSNEVPEATGDGIIMAEKVGASMKGLDEDHLVLYTCSVKISENESKTCAIRAMGGILVNMDGKRFWDELDMKFTNLAFEAKKQPEGRYFGIIDQAWVDANSPVGGAESADTLEELATKLGISPDGLAAEVKHYNEMYDAGQDTDFHRLTIAYKFETPPYYGIEVFPAHHGFDGGIEVDYRMQVKKADGSPFPGLYAEGGGVEYGLPGVNAIGGKVFTSTLLAQSLIEDLGYNVRQ